MAALTEAELLAAWEAGLGRPLASRALTLAAVACDANATELAALTLGRRDALLLALRERCFGGRLPCEISCPGCAERLELSLDIGDVRVEEGAAAAPRRVEACGVEVTFRPPTSADLLAVDPDVPDARRRLVEACVIDARTADGAVPLDALDDKVVDAIAARMGEADPQADVVLAMTCPSCGHQWLAPFDVAAYLWAEVDAYARRLLHEVVALATKFGWTEADVLAISPNRRRFYLEAVGT